jgi:hypothetical protein
MKYAIRLPVFRNGACGFEYYQPAAEPFIEHISLPAVLIPFVCDIKQAKHFDTEQEARDAIPEMAELHRNAWLISDQHESSNLTRIAVVVPV